MNPDRANVWRTLTEPGLFLVSCFFLLPAVLLAQQPSAEIRKRARDYGVVSGILPTGKWNAITDVAGVKVGHRTVTGGDSIRTGVTVIIPHDSNIFQQKVPAAVFVGNGFGKSIGTTQIVELGNLESPIALTNTLNAPLMADGLIDYILQLPGNEKVRSVNAVVGETNDGALNDIRGRHVTAAHLRDAIASAASGPVAEGCVGAGTGTICMGFKGGIGTASRKLPTENKGYTVGVLVQTNFGGILTINGAPVGRSLNNYYMQKKKANDADGSCMIIVATDAPLSARNLERLAKRAFLAFGTVGAFSSNGSGDYAIAFSTHPALRIPYNKTDTAVRWIPDLDNDDMSPLFLAALEATEEAIYNSLFMATDTEGMHGKKVRALPIDKTLKILQKHQALHYDRMF